jgi:hypothetical protein
VHHVPSNKNISDTAQEQLRVWIILRVCRILNGQLYARNLQEDCTVVYLRRWQLLLTTAVGTSDPTQLILFCTYIGLPTCFESKPLITICSAPETLIVVRPVIVSDRWEYTGLRAGRNNRSHLLQQLQNAECLKDRT